MAHQIMFDSEGRPLGVFAAGTGRVQSVWHAAETGCPVLPVPTLEPGDVPDRVTPEVYRVTPIDPESFDPLTGLSVIKARGVPGRLGVAGGHKRTNWRCAQPRAILDSFEDLRAHGATVEGVFWLSPGRFVVDGSLPIDDRTKSAFGADAHDVRYCAVADLTGAGRDTVMVSLVRVVCANTSAMARWDARRRDSILRIGHCRRVEERWRIDAPAFLAEYSGRLDEHVRKLHRLNEAALSPENALAYFERIIGTEPASPKGRTLYARKLRGLRVAYEREREHAVQVGIDPDSVRVAYEAVTNLANHGAVVAPSDPDKGDNGWRSPLNGARSATGRGLALIDGSITAPALELALALC